MKMRGQAKIGPSPPKLFTDFGSIESYASIYVYRSKLKREEKM